MRQFGRSLQVAALIVLPLAIALQLAEAIRLGPMLIMTVFGVSLFGVGRIVEGYAP